MATVPVSHRRIELDGVDVFYREAGPPEGPVVLLPHGYPCSSFQFRHFMAALGDRRRLIAPDLPGFGYSSTPDPERFSYTFAGYGEFLGRFVDALGLTRYAIYLHDYGSQHGFRLAMSAPERVAALIIQNGDIYLDRAGYNERCWPGSGSESTFDFARIIEAGDEVVVTYDATRKDGSRFRNTEVLTVEGDQVAEIEVYFGWNLA